MLSIFWWRKSKPADPLPYRVGSVRDVLWDRSYRHLNLNTYLLLKRLEAQLDDTKYQSESGLSWLVRYRRELRDVYAGFRPHSNEGQVAVIRRYMTTCPARMIPVCIWLLGKCADRFRLYGLAEYSGDLSPQVRKHVAKALRRAEAWTLLERMAKTNPHDERIQWFAAARVSHRPFPERLSSFIQSVDDSHAGEVATPSRMPFWALDRSWDYTPPKSGDVIRRMLRRIRHWVRWGIS